jgi:hypothetical protein
MHRILAAATLIVALALPAGPARSRRFTSGGVTTVTPPDRHPVHGWHPLV